MSDSTNDERHLAWLDNPEECVKRWERIEQAWREEHQLIGTDPYRTPEQKQRELEAEA
tara:strand:+ start:139 stop:312 length:174 start_codon:yes stop_codon:yes gene_type:complete